jgi:tetratricopeptide (TPR) repeat protein
MGPGLPSDLVQRIVERAEGIPLYAVELFRMLLDRGDVASTADGYRVVSSTAEVTAPQTLQALIAARLDALPVDERRLLQDASVLGKTFTLQSLAAIMGDDIARLEPLLRSLVRREFLSVDVDPRSPERGQYGFVGALVRETAHGTLAKRDRRERHLAAARYFETLGDDELAGVLASHYTDAYAASSPGPEADAVATQARIALRAAAGRSLALASPAQAATYLRRALDVSSDPAEVAALYEEIAGAELQAGAWGRSHAAAAEAVERYEALGDVVGRGRAASTLGECLLVESDIQAAADLLESALAGLPATGAEALGVGLRARLARAELFRGRPEAAIAAVDAALVVAARLDLIEATADLIVTRAWAVSMMGRHREAAVLQQGVIAFAQEQGLNRVRFRAINNLAADQGDHRPRQTLPLVREAMAEAERVGDRDWADKFAFVAIPAIWMGDWDYAEAVIESRWRDDLPTLLYVAPAIARIVIDALRGNWDAADRVVAEVRRRVADSESAQDREGLLTCELYVAFARGDIAAVRNAAERWSELARLSFDPLDVGLLLGIAASWSSDAAGIRNAISVLDGIRTRSELVLALESCLRASLAAHEGRAIAEVVQGYRDGLDGLRAVGHELWALFAGLDAVGLLDRDQPLVAAEMEQIRRFVAQTGATVLSGLLERRLEAARTRQGSAARPALARDQTGTAAEQNVLTTS